MTDLRISQLPPITGANMADTDQFVIARASTTQNFSVTRAELFSSVSAISLTGDLTVADRIVHSGDTNTAIRFPAADTITMETAGGEKFKITPVGLVAMGSIPVATPNLGLEVPIANETSTRSIGVTSPTYLTDFRATYMSYRGASVTGTTFGLSNARLGSLTFQNVSAGAVGTNTGPLVFATVNAERMRITAAGNVGIGTTNAGSLLTLYNATNASLAVQSDATANISTTRGSNDGQSGIVNSRKSRGTINAPLVVSNGDLTGQMFHQAYDGSTYVTTSQILAAVSTVTGANDIGGLLAFTTRTDGATSSLTERMRITAAGNVGVGNSAPVVRLHVTGATMTTGVVYRNQPAQTSKSAAATLTIAELLTGIIQYTGAADNLTLPTGTDIEGGLPATFPTNMSFDVSIINTGSGTATIVTNTGLTTVGGLTVAAGASGMLRFRKTATNTYTVYRIS